MNRAQRNTHRLLWWVLAPLLVGLVAWAVVDRVSYPEVPPPQEAPR